jgi:predicted helicase
LYPNADGSLFGNDTQKTPNLAPEFVSELRDGLGGANVSPEEIFAYIYAMLYAPSYRSRYADFLKRDFPRIPLPSDHDAFNRLATLGNQLIELHLLRNGQATITSYPKTGSNRVAKIEFKADPQDANTGRVIINADQYFEGVPKAAWDYTIGGYQPAHKWLKDRKGRLLSFDELQHYSQILAALNETIRLQGEIDDAIRA